MGENIYKLHLITYSCLENPMDRGAWQATVRGVTRVGHDLATKALPQSGQQLQAHEIILTSCHNGPSIEWRATSKL